MDEQRPSLADVRLGPLVFGVLFVVLGVAGVANADLNTAWIGAALLAAAGTAGLLGSIRAIRRESER